MRASRLGSRAAFKGSTVGCDLYLTRITRLVGYHQHVSRRVYAAAAHTLLACHAYKRERRVIYHHVLLRAACKRLAAGSQPKQRAYVVPGCPHLTCATIRREG